MRYAASCGHARAVSVLPLGARTGRGPDVVVPGVDVPGVDVPGIDVPGIDVPFGVLPDLVMGAPFSAGSR
jgi:hypothetical protein